MSYQYNAEVIKVIDFYEIHNVIGNLTLFENCNLIKVLLLTLS